MYSIVCGSTHGLADAEAFVEMLSELPQHPMPELRDWFDPTRGLTVARAPGRLDVMGGIADYSGSLVLQLPLREATMVALQRDPSPTLRVASLGAEANDREFAFAMPLANLERQGLPVDWTTARDRFCGDPRTRWAAYVAGAFLVLARERGVRFSEGARILISSSVPEGKGVSSSAALEVATMQAVASSYGIALEPRELAILCQKVENRVVGAPCGVMDQMTSACGQAGRLLALLCQPATMEGFIDIPGQVAFWGLDSGERHAVNGADYESVRIGAFIGYRMIAARAGLAARQADSDAHVDVIDPRWHGYLANVSPGEFEREFAPSLPERMDGFMFLAQYDGTTDPVTLVRGGDTYPVRAATAHPIHEHARIREFARLLQGEMTESTLQRLGELMYQSHASYSACGLGSPGADRLVRLVRAAGHGKGLYGARITGGGRGGTVAVLGRRDAGATVQAVAEEYARQTGVPPHVFTGSSDGAAAFGALELGPSR